MNRRDEPAGKNATGRDRFMDLAREKVRDWPPLTERQARTLADLLGAVR